MPTTTRLVIKEDVLNLIGSRLHNIIGSYGQPLTTSSIAGAATSLVDTSLSRGARGASDFDRCLVEIIELEAGGPAVGEVAGVDGAGFASATGTLTVSPAFSNPPQGATDYLLYPPQFSPEQVNKAADDVQRGTESPELYFPSMVIDPYFAGTLTTTWPDADATAVAQTADTTAFAETSAYGTVLLGESALKVTWTSTAVTEGVQSLEVPVTENQGLHLTCWVYAEAQEVSVSLYDETANAVIGEAVSVDQAAWTEVRMNETVPSGCETVRVRFLGTQTSGTTTFYVDAPVVLQSRSFHPYPAPSWLIREGQLRDTLYFPQGFASESDSSYMALTRQARRAMSPAFIRQDRALSQFQIHMENPGHGPIALECWRSHDAFASDTATTRLDREYMKYRVAANVLRRIGDDLWREYNRTAQRLAKRLGYGLDELVMRENPQVALRA